MFLILRSKKENVPNILNKIGGKYFRYLFVIWLATESVFVNNNFKTPISPKRFNAKILYMEFFQRGRNMSFKH